MEPCGTRVESLQSFAQPCETSGPTALAESCGTLKPSYNLTSNHPGPPRSPRRTSWDPARTVLEWNLALQEFWWNSHGTLPQTSPDRWWNPGETFPGSKKLVEPWWNPRPEHDGLVEPWWQPGGTLVEPYLKPPRTTLQPSQNLVKPWQNSGGNGGTLVEPSSNQTTPALEEIAGTLVEPSWNLTSNHPGPPCSPGETLVEPYLKPPRPPRSLESWWNPGGTLVKPAALEDWWNRGTLPQTTPDHPALAEPGGTLVEPWWNPGETLVEPWWNPGGTLVEPLVEPLAQGRPEPPRSLSELAETPKLSAVGEKIIKKK